MNRLFSFIIFSFWGFLTAPLPIYAGGWSGNGGGHSKMKDNIWFLGEASVPYCVEVGPNYPFEAVELKGLVQETINDWVTFFKQYGLESWGKRSFGRHGALVENLPDVALDFKEVDCPKTVTTGYKPSGLIHVTFGTENPVIQSVRTLHADESYGLALRPDYDHKTYRNGGYVWVAKFTESRQALKHILLHEWGHVMGMPHDSVFVMESNIGRTLDRQIPNVHLLGHIEAPFWPFRLQDDRPVNLSSAHGFRFPIGGSPREMGCKDQQKMPASEVPKPILRAFGLRKPAHCISLYLSRNPGFGFPQTYKLWLEDSHGVKREAIGTFKPVPHNIPKAVGPGLFSKFPDSGGGFLKDSWAYVPVDPRPGQMSLHGVFNFHGGVHAARISWNRGPVFEIFSARRRAWMTLTTSGAF